VKSSRPAARQYFLSNIVDKEENVDPTTVTVTLNVFVIAALMLLAVSAILLIGSAVPLLEQARRTVNAYERLADTLENELKPTLADVREVLEGVNQIRSVTAQRVTEVGHKVEEVSGSFGEVAGQAKRQSSVWGAGLIAGIKAYLSARDEQGPRSEPRQITQDIGEQHVELKQ